MSEHSVKSASREVSSQANTSMTDSRRLYHPTIFATVAPIHIVIVGIVTGAMCNSV